MKNQFNLHDQAKIETINQIEISRFVPLWNETQPQIDLQVLADELARLKNSQQKTATTPEQREALTHIASAEAAAKENDGPKTLAFLSKAGSWALETAKDIGVKLAVEAISKSLNL
jgi:hypothetical protein